MTNKLVFICLLILGSPLSHAQERQFTECISDWQKIATHNGLSTSTIEEVIPSLKHLPDILGYDRAQPEFTQTFAQYLNKRLTPGRVDRGQDLLQAHTTFLHKLTNQHGIPGRYLISFWGLETNFGKYMGKMPTLSSLATLACDERRSDYFTDELLTALELMERESLSSNQMQGSWAGAMGHTQFMPTAYQLYAIDGDGDGRIDLWKSEHDALASGANFLKNLGWQSEQRWGREIILPDDFPYAVSGLHNRQPLSYWSDLGVIKTNGNKLASLDLMASVIVPAGHTGPAFLVYPNFHVIMRWNHSESYALAVGLLADQIAGQNPLTNPPSLSEAALSRQTIKRIQANLNELQFDTGIPDGIIGPNTRAALRDFQKTKNLTADGYPDQLTLEKLKINI